MGSVSRVPEFGLLVAANPLKLVMLNQVRHRGTLPVRGTIAWATIRDYLACI